VPITAIALSRKEGVVLQKEGAEIYSFQGSLEETLSLLKKDPPKGKVGVTYLDIFYFREEPFPPIPFRKILPTLPFTFGDRLLGGYSSYISYLVRKETREKVVVRGTFFSKEFPDQIKESFSHLSLRWLTPAPFLLASHPQTPEGNSCFLGKTDSLFLRKEKNRLSFASSLPYGYETIEKRQGFSSFLSRLYSLAYGEAITLILPEGISLPFPENWPIERRPESFSLFTLASIGLDLLEKVTPPHYNLSPPPFLTLPAPLKGEIRYLIPFLLFLIPLACIQFASGTSKLKEEIRYYDQSIRAISERLLPGEKIVDPVRQIRSYLERGKGGGKKEMVLPKLLSLFSNVPQETDLVLDELSYRSFTWIVEGKIKNFSALDLLKEKWGTVEWVSRVEVERAETQPQEGKVLFRIVLYPKEG